jgi:hypothetical protein
MGYRKVQKVTRLSDGSDDVVATVDFSGRAADSGSLVTVFVTQASGAVAIGSAVVPVDDTKRLDVTATLQDPGLRRFTAEDPLTVVSHVTEIWNSVLLDPSPPDSRSEKAQTVWEFRW